MTEGFWLIPDETTISRAPAAILKEQATALREMTKGELNGVITNAPAPPGQMAYRLGIMVPALNNYSYVVLIVQYPLLSIWPALIESNVTNEKAEAENEVKFNDVLRKILGSAEMQRVIGALRAQVRAAP
jgi:hypothetical protein